MLDLAFPVLRVAFGALQIGAHAIQSVMKYTKLFPAQLLLLGLLEFLFCLLHLGFLFGHDFLALRVFVFSLLKLFFTSFCLFVGFVQVALLAFQVLLGLFEPVVHVTERPEAAVVIGELSSCGAAVGARIGEMGDDLMGIVSEAKPAQLGPELCKWFVERVEGTMNSAGEVAVLLGEIVECAAVGIIAGDELCAFFTNLNEALTRGLGVAHSVLDPAEKAEGRTGVALHVFFGKVDVDFAVLLDHRIHFVFDPEEGVHVDAYFLGVGVLDVFGDLLDALLGHDAFSDAFLQVALDGLVAAGDEDHAADHEAVEQEGDEHPRKGTFAIA